MARRIFTETFGTLYRQEDLAAFLDAALARPACRRSCAIPPIAVRLAIEDGAIVGYCKIGPVAFPGDWPGRDRAAPALRPRRHGRARASRPC